MFLAVSHDAWRIVGFIKYVWNNFLSAPMFISGNTRLKQYKCSGSKCVGCWSYIFSLGKNLYTEKCWESCRQTQGQALSIYIIYTHAYTHITHTHTHTHTPLYKELYVYHMYYIMNVHTICCNNSVYYLYSSLFWCEPTLQIQMAKHFVGCMDFYCKFQGSNYFCLCFILRTKLSMFFLFL